MHKLKLLALICCSTLLSKTCSATCQELLAGSPEVEKYASAISSGFEPSSSLEQKIKHIIEYIHGPNGLNTQVFSTDKFFKLYSVFGGKEITQNEQVAQLPEFRGLSGATLEGYITLYNKYMVPDARGILFAPTAEDLIKYRMAFGCTQYARTFISIAKTLKLFRPEDIRYVVSSSYKDYNKSCPTKGSIYDDKATINGHQFVLLRYDNSWWFINTSNKNFEKVAVKDLNYKDQNLTVRFPSYKDKDDSGHNILLVRYIGEDSNDGACDNSFMHLMNISVSGHPGNNVCFWSGYKVQG